MLWEDVSTDGSPRILNWFADESCGIATDLTKVHNFSYTNEDPSQATLATDKRKRYGIHGDIKPENILVFYDSPGEMPRWVISDFGLCEFHSRESRSQMQVRIAGHSPTYRAPEADIDTVRSTCYDVWCLGCVFLQNIIWILKGWEGVESFSEERSMTHKFPYPDEEYEFPPIPEDVFFETFTGAVGGKLMARVKPSVITVCLEHGYVLDEDADEDDRKLPAFTVIPRVPTTCTTS